MSWKKKFHRKNIKKKTIVTYTIALSTAPIDRPSVPRNQRLLVTEYFKRLKKNTTYYKLHAYQANKTIHNVQMQGPSINKLVQWTVVRLCELTNIYTETAHDLQDEDSDQVLNT